MRRFVLVASVVPVIALFALVAPSGGSGASAAVNWDPSGQAMPVGDLPGWHQVFADNFANDAYPLGSFSGCQSTGCPGASSFPWGATPDGHPDTSGHCQYTPSQTLSVSGGVLDVFVHTASNGTCMGAALFPLMPKLTFERYSIRFRGDPVAGFKEIAFLWPVDGIHGEIDYPENHLDSTITGSLHTIAGGSQIQRWTSGVASTSWHTATMEWTPSSVTFILDGVILGTTTLDVPQTPMTLIVRGESDLAPAPKPLPSSQGHFQVDWLTAYSYAPVPSVTSIAPSTVGQGAQATTVDINGPGFTPDATVSFSDPGVVPTGPPTYVNPNELSIPVQVAANTTLGPVDVTVHEALGTGTCKGCLLVTPAPVVSTVSGTVVAGGTVPVTLGGSGFQSGVAVSSLLPGVVFGTPTAVAPTSVTVPVTVRANATNGTYGISVTNPDGGTVACATCLVVLTVPAAPTAGTATPGDASASVTFGAPISNGGLPIAGYVVTATDTTTPTNGGQSASGAASPIVVSGLVNGDRYRFSVTAANAVGTGTHSTLSNSVVPAGIPGAPVIGSAVAARANATVSFAPPVSSGGIAIAHYTIVASDLSIPGAGGQSRNGSTSPITIYGLVHGDTYRFTVTATNAMGTGPPSAASNAVVP